jgi:hypothetical protein
MKLLDRPNNFVSQPIFHPFAPAWDRTVLTSKQKDQGLFHQTNRPLRFDASDQMIPYRQKFSSRISSFGLKHSPYLSKKDNRVIRSLILLRHLEGVFRKHARPDGLICATMFHAACLGLGLKPPLRQTADTGLMDFDSFLTRLAAEAAAMQHPVVDFRELLLSGPIRLASDGGKARPATAYGRDLAIAETAAAAEPNLAGRRLPLRHLTCVEQHRCNAARRPRSAPAGPRPAAV